MLFQQLVKRGVSYSLQSAIRHIQFQQYQLQCKSKVAEKYLVLTELQREEDIKWTDNLLENFQQFVKQKEIDIQQIVKKAYQHNQVEEGACSYILTVLENYQSVPLIHTSTLGDLQWLQLRYDQNQLQTIEFSTPNYIEFLFPLRLGLNEGNPSQAQFMVNESQELDLILLYNKTVAMNLFQKQIKQIIEPFCQFSYDNLDLQLICDMIAEKTEEVSKMEKEDTPFKKFSKLNQPGKFKDFSKSGFPGEIFVQLAQVKSQLSF